MNVDAEFGPEELAKRGAKFCHNPREAVSEWGVIKAGIEDELRSLRAGSHSIFEMHMSRMRLVRFLESFRHSLTKRPEIFDAESLRVLSELESLTLEWVRRASRTKGNRFVDTPCEKWMGAWQEFCDAYESFSRTVEFELAFEELNKSEGGIQGDDPRKDTAKSALLKASAAAATESSRNKPGTGEELLKAHLRQHHLYKSGTPPEVGNITPIASSTDLSKALDIAVGTVSKFFQRWFKSRKLYDMACQREDFGTVAFALQLMSGDVTPPELRHSLEEEARSRAEADE